MDRKKINSLVIIGVIVGFMLAIQFQTVSKPEVRDTRDTWQLREDLVKEKELQSRLIKEIRSNEEKLNEYETEREQGKENTLRNTLEELKKRTHEEEKKQRNTRSPTARTAKTNGHTPLPQLQEPNPRENHKPEKRD